MGGFDNISDNIPSFDIMIITLVVALTFLAGISLAYLDSPSCGTITTLKTTIHTDRISGDYPYHVITSEGYWLYPANDSISQCVDTYASSVHNDHRILNITIRKSLTKDYIINIDGYEPPSPKPTPFRVSSTTG